MSANARRRPFWRSASDLRRIFTHPAFVLGVLDCLAAAVSAPGARLPDLEGAISQWRDRATNAEGDFAAAIRQSVESAIRGNQG